MIKTLLKSIRQYKFHAIGSSVAVGLEVIIEIIIPLVTARLIDFGVEKSDLNAIYKYGLILFIFSILQILFGVISAVFASIAGPGFASNLRQDLFDKIQTFSFYNIDKFSTGSLVSRLTTDITNLQNAFQLVIRLTVRGFLMLCFSVIASFQVNARIASVLLFVIPIIGGTFYLIVKKAYPLFDKMFKAYDNLNNILSENLRGMRVVKTFNRENFEKHKFKSLSGFIYSIGLTAERFAAMWMPIMNLAIYITSITILWIGAKSIIASGNDVTRGMTTGSLMSLITYSIQILMSLMMVSFTLVMLVIANASVKRIAECLSEDADIKDNDNAIENVGDGSIEFKNVNFSYEKDSKNLVLKGINLKIEKGETIGIMGMTGSGKSSLVNLIPRFYDVNSGEILIGNVNIKNYKIKSLRQAIGMVLQKNVLFKGTIKSNMLFGNQNATDEEIENALKVACADEFILNKPEGINLEVEQGGANFSGGQKQRICIARALIKKPKILILDDSTSAVDTKTESIIRKGFYEQHKDTTIIIIAQRISSIMECDKIVVMDNGKICDVGTHDKLLEMSSIYKETYDLQIKGGLE